MVHLFIYFDYYHFFLEGDVNVQNVCMYTNQTHTCIFFREQEA